MVHVEGATITIGTVELEGAVRFNSREGVRSPTHRTERGFDYDTYVRPEPIEATVEAFVTSSTYNQLQRLKEDPEPFSASIDKVLLPKAKMTSFDPRGEGTMPEHYQVSISIKEVEEAKTDTQTLVIDSSGGVLASPATEARASLVTSSEDTTGTGDDVTNENGIVATLNDFRDKLAGIF